MKGLVHIYCGDGKGKTTAALGAAIRAAGREKRVLIARFLKTEDSGEIPSLKAVPGITLLPGGPGFGFSWEMSPETRRAAGNYYRKYFLKAWNMAVGEAVEAEAGAEAGAEAEAGYDMLVLDEVIDAINLGFVEEQDLIALLERKPESLEVILTGRNPSEALCAQAAYLTEMKKIKHPFTQGVPAREGVEY